MLSVPDKIIEELNQLLQEEAYIKLSKLIHGRFNIFQILGIEKKEIRYSRILAWLLDPIRNHHLGEIFLRKFMEMLLKKDSRASRLKEIGIEFVDIDCASFGWEMYKE